MQLFSHLRFRAFLIVLLASAALELCLFCMPLFASSPIVLIKESDIKPYSRAIEGFRGFCGCTVLEFNVEETDAIEQALKEHPAAVVTVGTNAFRKARGIRNLPLVYSMTIPADIAEPLPDNVSGVSMDIAPEEYLDAIRGLFPDAKRIGLLYNPENTGQFVRDAEIAARSRQLTLVAKSITDPRRMPALLDDLRKSIDVFLLLPDKTLIHPDALDYVMLVSFQNNLPVFSFSSRYLDRGAAAALTVSPFSMGAQTGILVRQLMNGTKGPLRHYSRNAKLVVNKTVCTKLGVRFNEETVRSAEKVD